MMMRMELEAVHKYVWTTDQIMEGLNTERTWVFTTSLVLKESHLHLQLRNSCTVVTAPHALYRNSGSLESQLSCKRQEKKI